MNGPVPTGLVLVAVAGSVMLDQMCCGTMNWAAKITSAGVSGFENLNVTWFGPVAVTDDNVVPLQMPFTSMLGLALT